MYVFEKYLRIIGCKTGMKGWISIVVYRDKPPTVVEKNV